VVTRQLQAKHRLLEVMHPYEKLAAESGVEFMAMVSKACLSPYSSFVILHFIIPFFHPVVLIIS